MAFERDTKLRILFIAGNKNSAKFLSDPAFIYRCQNPALALLKKGHEVKCIHYKDLSQQKNPVDLIIFHRPCFRNWQARWFLKAELKKRRKQGTVLIADFDDLVFDSTFAEFSPGVINGYVSLQQTKKNFAQHAAALNYFDVLTVSTQPLQVFAQQQLNLSAVACLPNSPHLSWEDKELKAPSANHYDISYLPGTRSHDKDFASIAQPLAHFLAEHKDARLTITGVLDKERFPTALSRLSNQIQWRSKKPYSDYWQVVNDGHIHLAPLQDTVFNQCKSALKAIEANYFNRPVIASPIPDMQRFNAPGVHLAQSDNDWYQQLTAHYQNSQQLYSLRDSVLNKYTPSQHANDIIACYEKHTH